LATNNGVEKKIRHGCRCGDADALRTVVYQLADELYTVALAELASEDRAYAAVIEAWQRMLNALQRWRFAGSLRNRALALLGRVIAEMSEPHPAGQITETVGTAQEGRSEIQPAPDALVAALTRLTDRMAPAIAEARQRRKHRLRLALAGGLVILGVLIGLGGAFGNRILIARNSQLQFETLQQRIVAAQLRAAVQQAEMELADPTGAQASVREGYQRIGLVLEEIVNAASLQQTSRLRFVKRRIANQNLIQLARQAACQSNGTQREKLMMVVLVLEEVANL